MLLRGKRVHFHYTATINSGKTVPNGATRTKDGVATSWMNDDAYRLLGQQTAGSYFTLTSDATGNLTEENSAGSRTVSRSITRTG